jgi:DNA-binding CsgD family transcriptional regulator
MKRRFLEDCLAEGLSLEAIGRLAGRHPSTVSYWLKKHGLEARNAGRHSPKGGLKREELERLVNAGLTLREIADQLDRSVSTVRHWMGRHELKTAGHRRRRPTGDPSRAEMACRRHGHTTFVREGRGYYRCGQCRIEAVSKRRQIVKRKLVEEAGGKCSVCEYARCQQALQFHHLDPSTKEFHLGDKGISRSLARSRAEARKCILLCANCHAEVEAGLVALPINFRAKANPG